MAFFEFSNLCSCTSRTLPSTSGGRDLGLLFAGGSSEKSMYSLTQILWSSFVGSAGRPAFMGAMVLCCGACESEPGPRAKSSPSVSNGSGYMRSIKS